MLCTTCLGVLEECRNLILFDPHGCEIPETTAGKRIFRQGTIDTTALELGPVRTILSDTTPYHDVVIDPEDYIENILNTLDTSSDEEELTPHHTTNSQPVLPAQRKSVRRKITERHAIYGQHTALANLKAAAGSGCQICWQTWSLLCSEKSNTGIGISEVHEAVESEEKYFRTCIVVNNKVFEDTEFSVDIYYDGTDCPQKVCRFHLLPGFRMYGISWNCYNC
jgi:hypothetical protein